MPRFSSELLLCLITGLSLTAQEWQSHLQAGEDHVRNGRPVAAEARLRRACDQAAEDQSGDGIVKACTAFALNAAELGETESARQAFLRVLESDPESEKAHSFLQSYNFRYGRYCEAAESGSLLLRRQQSKELILQTAQSMCGCLKFRDAAKLLEDNDLMEEFALQMQKEAEAELKGDQPDAPGRPAVKTIRARRAAAERRLRWIYAIKQDDASRFRLLRFYHHTGDTSKARAVLREISGDSPERAAWQDILYPGDQAD